MVLKFTKMQGLGNDFMVIDATKQFYHLPPEQIQKLADRRYGIGFDQLLLIETSSNPGIDFNYKIYNADGSSAEQCGNGARCIGRYIFDNQLTNKPKILVQAPKTVIEINEETNGDININMGQPDFIPAHLPMLHNQLNPPFSLKLEHLLIQYYVVNVGNPHVIIKVENSTLNNEIEMIGLHLNQHPIFPEGVNVSLVQVEDHHQLRINVYERGVGPTPACGSAACASAVIAIKQQWAFSPISVKQQGGDLLIQWDGQPNAPIMMQGPAETVFHGEVILPIDTTME